MTLVPVRSVISVTNLHGRNAIQEAGISSHDGRECRAVLIEVPLFSPEPRPRRGRVKSTSVAHGELLSHLQTSLVHAQRPSSAATGGRRAGGARLDSVPGRRHLQHQAIAWSTLRLRQSLQHRGKFRHGGLIDTGLTNREAC